ncbi:MAG: CHRD domain-containing protein [Cryobacterium sp.]
MRTTNRVSTKALAVFGAVLALTLADLGVANAKPGGVPAIPLNNGQETPGATGGSSGFFSYSINGTEFCYTLSARGLSVPAVAAHVHVAPRNTAGPVVIPLMVGSGTDWTVQNCTTASATVLQAITASPGSYYVNVHTPTFPAGEIRGQLK